MDDKENQVIENKIEEIIVSTSQLCHLLDISKETVSQWTKSGMPKAAHGKYNLKAVLDWRGLSNKTEGMTDEARKNKAEADWKEVKALREKHNFDVQKGKYFSKEEIADEWVRRITEIKNSLLLLPSHIANNFSDISVKEKIHIEIEKTVYEMLEQYSRTGKYTPKFSKSSSKKGR